MGYRIEQTDQYLGNDNWQWRAWIEASPEELDALKSVTWLLHPTYTIAEVSTTDRATQFAIERTAWGRFQLGAKLHFANGSTSKRLRRQLQLWYPDDEAAPREEAMPGSHPLPQRGTPKIFISYGADDRELAASVADKLSQNGFQVADPAKIEPGAPWQLETQKMMRESDLVLGIVSSEFASPQVIRELNNAHRSEKPLLTVVGPEIGKVYGLDPELSRSTADPADPEFERRLVQTIQKKLE